MKIEVGDYVWISGWSFLQKVEKISLEKVYFSDTHWVDRETIYAWIKEKHAKVFILKEAQDERQIEV